MNKLKSVFYCVIALSLILVVSPSLMADDASLEGDSKTTCYATYQTGGTTTIWRCGSCQSISNAQNPTDSGKCNPM